MVKSLVASIWWHSGPTSASSLRDAKIRSDGQELLEMADEMFES
jgi:hypothetical protein